MKIKEQNSIEMLSEQYLLQKIRYTFSAPIIPGQKRVFGRVRKENDYFTGVRLERGRVNLLSDTIKIQYLLSRSAR